MQSSGDNSPVIQSEGDVTVVIGPEAPPKPDYISAHDGAGAMLMIEPDFSAMVDASIRGKTEKAIGRLVNGTGLAFLEQQNEPGSITIPWVKVRVLDGEFKDQEGWIIQSSVKKQ